MLEILYNLVLVFGALQLITFLILALPMPKGYKHSLT